MTDRQVTCNDDQRLFVIPSSGGGFSCFGYKNCFRDSKALAEMLDRPDLAPTEEGVGTLVQYDNYRTLVGLASKVDLGTWFTPGTPKQVVDILESARRTGQRLRIHLGDQETGKAWDDRPSSGRIGRSMGPLKTPLLIANRRSMGGEAILTDCIVRIEETPGGRELYSHPDYTPLLAEEPEAAAAPGM